MKEEERKPFSIEEMDDEWKYHPHMEVSPDILCFKMSYYSEQIRGVLARYEQLKLYQQKDILELIQMKYRDLNHILKILLEENGGYLHYYDEIIKARGNWGPLGPYSFLSLMQYGERLDGVKGGLNQMLDLIDKVEKSEDFQYWFEKDRKGRYRVITVFFDLWDALDYEVNCAYDSLADEGAFPNEPVATLEAIEQADKANSKIVNCEIDMPYDGIEEDLRGTSEQNVTEQEDEEKEKKSKRGRESILDQLLALADKGDWVRDELAEEVKEMLKTILGVNEKQKLTGKDAVLSEKLWTLFEKGKESRVKVIWLNLVGYFRDKGLFKPKGSPALYEDFYGPRTVEKKYEYTNIDKGSPSKGQMSNGFREVLELLDKYAPK